MTRLSRTTPPIAQVPRGYTLIRSGKVRSHTKRGTALQALEGTYATGMWIGNNVADGRRLAHCWLLVQGATGAGRYGDSAVFYVNHIQHVWPLGPPLRTSIGSFFKWLGCAFIALAMIGAVTAVASLILNHYVAGIGPN